MRTPEEQAVFEAKLYAEVFDPNVSDLEYFLSRKRYHQEKERTDALNKELGRVKRFTPEEIKTATSNAERRWFNDPQA